MPVPFADLKPRQRVQYYLSNLVIRTLVSGLALVPYRRRVPLMGAVVRKLGPVVGYHKRIRTNLALTHPAMSGTEVDQMCHQVCDNIGRSFAELFAGKPFWDRANSATLSGPGLLALERARAEGRPVVLVTAHFGNYDAARSKLTQMGFEMGALYRRMANPYFNADYLKAISATASPMFEQGKRGMVEMVRHLKKGGTIAIVTDLHAQGGTDIEFFGTPALTSLVPAELSLKYNAVMIPVYGIRKENGLDFDIIMNDEIPASDALTMTKHLSADLEAEVQRHMGQWFWIHRRWKTHRK